VQNVSKGVTLSQPCAVLTCPGVTFTWPIEQRVLKRLRWPSPTFCVTAELQE